MVDLDAEFPGCVIPGPMRVKFARVNPAAKLPAYATDGSVGLDLQTMTDIVLLPGASERAPTGIAIELPPGHEAQIRPRSSVSREGLLVHQGTCDTDYRGELKLNLTNVGNKTFVAKAGDRIAQLVIVPVPRVEVVEVGVGELSSTERGDKGFGSSGVR